MTLRRIGLRKLLTLGIACAAGALATASLHAQDYDNVVHLDQGWSDVDRMQYYFTSQGSAAMSYDIFLNLEVANGETPFRANDNLATYGFAPSPADPTYNPDGLPIGIGKTVVTEGRWQGEWVGLTCAACHNGRLQYKGTTIGIAGGNNNAINFYQFLDGLDAAMAATLADQPKLDRLMERLGAETEADQAAALERLTQDAASIHVYRTVTAAPPSEVGPGRMDALGLIHNQVTSRQLGVPENWQAPLAPTKPSFVWNIPQSAWAQWSGVLSDPVMRNVGEVLGVFARMDLTSATPEEGLFESTVDVAGQILSENLLRRLAPPQWPEEILGAIDRKKAAQGATLFVENCAGCHSTWPHRWSEPRNENMRFIENAIVPIALVGTDPQQFRSTQFEFLPTVFSGPLKDHLPPPFTGATLISPAVMFRTTIQTQVFSNAMDKLNLSPEDRLSAHGYVPEEGLTIPALNAYKANPVEGMWSSPPYLHNGSVPNLYELLLPAAERSKTFYVGRDFDPVKVGVDTSGESGTFLFDTSLVGNFNTGHSFEDGPIGNGIIGRALTEDERWALIEFLKSVPNEPRQISPFGGPAEPVSAWQDPTFFHVANPGTYQGAPQ